MGSGRAYAFPRGKPAVPTFAAHATHAAAAAAAAAAVLVTTAAAGRAGRVRAIVPAPHLRCAQAHPHQSHPTAYSNALL